MCFLEHCVDILQEFRNSLCNSNTSGKNSFCDSLNYKCNCIICHSGMAQAQIDMEINNGNKTSNLIGRKNSFKESVKSSKPKDSIKLKKSKSSCLSTKNFHSIPLTLRIQSKPLEDGISPRIILDDDWILYVGGANGEIGVLTHVNIRKLCFEGAETNREGGEGGGGGEGGEGLTREGLSLPIQMLPCLLEGLQQLTTYRQA
jgi:hypothetical protein